MRCLYIDFEGSSLNQVQGLLAVSQFTHAMFVATATYNAPEFYCHDTLCCCI